jgi:hypothetical protein
MADERPYQQHSTASIRARAEVRPVAPKVLPPLTQAEHARIKETVAIIKDQAPEIIPLIKGLHELGMIDGWRAVTITKVKS